jgi:hypothetical protein
MRRISCSPLPGSDGDSLGIASFTFEVMRTTTGDSATPLDFSGDCIDNVVNLGSGDDTVFGGKGTNVITGNAGNDVLIGGAGGALRPSAAATPSMPSTATTICKVALARLRMRWSRLVRATTPSMAARATTTSWGGNRHEHIMGCGGALQTLYGNGSFGDYIVGGSSPTASNVSRGTRPRPSAAFWRAGE